MVYELPLVGIIIALVIAVYILARRLNRLRSSKISLSVKYGKMSEQFLPFLKEYPYDPERFRFIGSPIDGLQFEDDRLVFIEFKTGDSRLSARQRQVKELVEKGKVEFREVRIR